LPGDRFPRTRKWFLACLSVPFLAACVYAGFLSAVSIWVGLCNLNRAGFWVPILAGFVALLAVLWMFLMIIGAFSHLENEEDSLIV
jgi:hypothetical protein